jgi:hypothetical protein
MPFPGNHDFNYYRGDTYEFDVVLKNQDGSNFDLSLYETVAFTIGTQRGSGGTKTTALATKVITTDQASVRCTITSTVGRGLAAGPYFYDVQITDTTPNPSPSIIYTVLTGIMNVVDDITGA